MRISYALIASLFVLVLSSGVAAAVVINPFAPLIGKWGGNGIMTLEGGKRERIICDFEYTGNSIQLRLVIRCNSGERNIRMTARLSSNAGHLLGFWEEKYFSAAGAITGTATENKIDFTVSGNVNGKMIVNYAKNSQKVLITTQNVAFKSLNITMRRR